MPQQAAESCHPRSRLRSRCPGGHSKIGGVDVSGGNFTGPILGAVGSIEICASWIATGSHSRAAPHPRRSGVALPARKRIECSLAISRQRRAP